MAITSIEEVQKLLEGATLTKVDKSSRTEGLFDLVFSKGGTEYEATLYATDLGWWMDRVAQRGSGVITAEDLNFFTLVFDHVEGLLESEPSLSENPLQTIWDSDRRGFECKITGKKWEFTSSKSCELGLDTFTETQKGLQAFSDLVWWSCHDDVFPSSYDPYQEAWLQIFWNV